MLKQAWCLQKQRKRERDCAQTILALPVKLAPPSIKPSKASGAAGEPRERSQLPAPQAAAGGILLAPLPPRGLGQELLLAPDFRRGALSREEDTKMRGFVLGLILGLLALPAAAWLWLSYGQPPVAVTDPAVPYERQLVNIPLHARIHQEMPAPAAMEPSAANLLLGAEIYRQQCASCHGQYGHPSAFGPHMYPASPQLWAPHGNGVVGVSDDPAGETYWKVKNGIRLSGMPSYAKVLNEEQMWQVSVLLANADKPLPAAALAVLKQPLVAPPAQAATTEQSPVVIPVEPVPTN